MNWKFWTWAEQVREARRERDDLARQFNDVVKTLENQSASRHRREDEIEALQATLHFKHRPPGDQPTEAQIASALAVVDESTPLWRAVHRLLDWLEEDQKTAVCLGNLNDAQRHYNAGRLAMCEDLRHQLLQKWAEAKRE